MKFSYNSLKKFENYWKVIARNNANYNDKKNKKKCFFLDMYVIIGIIKALNLIKPLISAHV